MLICTSTDKCRQNHILKLDCHVVYKAAGMMLMTLRPRVQVPLGARLYILLIIEIIFQERFYEYTQERKAQIFAKSHSFNATEHRVCTKSPNVVEMSAPNPTLSIPSSHIAQSGNDTDYVYMDINTPILIRLRQYSD